MKGHEDLGALPPKIVARPPGPQSRTWLLRSTQAQAPMGPVSVPEPTAIRANVPPGAIVYARARGSNVVDVDGNRYVDLVAGFGALLLGHQHPGVMRALALQSERLSLALGDVYPADAKIAFVERIAKLYPDGPAQVIVGQSGADAVTAALKTAALHTGRGGIIAFQGGYHGLSYAPLAASSLRASYRVPFEKQLNPRVFFAPYPENEARLAHVLEVLERQLATGDYGALLFEPILGRGGCIVPPPGFLAELTRLARAHGALSIADEIWTGLGRAGSWLVTGEDSASPDLICLGKGLGGALPISACIGRHEVMQAWRREEEVVHTSTFAGAPLACTSALATLDALTREGLVARSERLGESFRAMLAAELSAIDPNWQPRGRGLMLAIDFGTRPGLASSVQRALLEQGYLCSTGGGRREVLILTPPLNIPEPLLEPFAKTLGTILAVLPR